MKFPIAYSNNNAIGSTTVANFIPLTGVGIASSATETGHQCVIGETCSISDWLCSVNVAPGVGAWWDVVVRNLSADTVATNRIQDTNLTPTTPWTGSVSFADGDRLTISITPSVGTAPVANGGFSSILYFNTIGQRAFWLGLSAGNVSATVDSFMSMSGVANAVIATDGVAWTCPTPCTIDRVRMISRVGSPGTAGSGKSFATSVKINATDQLTTTIADAAVTAVTTGSVAMSIGDQFRMHTVPSATAPTARGVSWCVSYIPGVNGESIMGFGGGSAYGAINTTTFSAPFGGGFSSTYSSEAGRLVPLPGPLTIRGLILNLAVAPGGAATHTANMRNNLGNTGLTTGALTGATTQQQDTTNTVTLAAGTWSLRHVTTGTPADPGIGGVTLGFVIITTQPGGGASASDTVVVGADTATRLATFPRTATEPAVTQSDVATRSLALGRTAIEPAITVSDQAIVSTAHPRAAADTVIVAADTATRATVAARTATEPPITVLDTVTRLVSRVRAAIDLVVQSDLATRLTARARAATDTVTVVPDTATRATIAVRTAGDLIIVTDDARVTTWILHAGDLVLQSDTATVAQAGPRRRPGHFDDSNLIAHYAAASAPGRILGGPPGHFEDPT